MTFLDLLIYQKKKIALFFILILTTSLTIALALDDVYEANAILTIYQTPEPYQSAQGNNFLNSPSAAELLPTFLNYSKKFLKDHPELVDINASEIRRIRDQVHLSFKGHKKGQLPTDIKKFVEELNNTAFIREKTYTLKQQIDSLYNNLSAVNPSLKSYQSYLTKAISQLNFAGLGFSPLFELRELSKMNAEIKTLEHSQLLIEAGLLNLTMEPVVSDRPIMPNKIFMIIFWPLLLSSFFIWGLSVWSARERRE